MESDTTPISRAEWRRVLPTLVAVFLATRLLVVLVAAFVEDAVPLANQPETADSRPILTSLTSSDGVFYLGLAREGYHLEPVKQDYRDWVFFPLYPAAVRATSVVTCGDVALAAVLAANAAFLAAMVALYALSRRYLDQAAAVRAVVFMAIAPGAVAYTMAYGDSLFLLLVVGAFLAAETRHWVVMGVLVGLAALSRLPGVLLVLPLAILIWTSPGRPRLALGWLAAAPVALAGFAIYQWSTLGRPDAFIQAQAAWDIPPLLNTATTAAAVTSAVPWLLLATLLGYVFLFVYMRVDRIRAAYVAFAIVTVLTVVVAGRLQSDARYLSIGFPFAWVLANRKSEWFRVAWPIVSAGLFTIFVFLDFTTFAP
jgi:hypothetical protein